MPYENNTGTNSRNFYGPRSRNEGIEGSYTTDNAISQLAFDITGANLNDDAFAFDLSILPAGSKPLRAIFHVDEAFDLGGTSPVISIGTDGSESTNGVDLDEASAEAVGAYVIDATSFNGTWAARLAANTQVSVSLGGTTPTSGEGGHMRVVIEFSKLN